MLFFSSPARPAPLSKVFSVPAPRVSDTFPELLSPFPSGYGAAQQSDGYYHLAETVTAGSFAVVGGAVYCKAPQHLGGHAAVQGERLSAVHRHVDADVQGILGRVRALPPRWGFPAKER